MNVAMVQACGDEWRVGAGRYGVFGLVVPGRFADDPRAGLNAEQLAFLASDRFASRNGEVTKVVIKTCEPRDDDTLSVDALCHSISESIIT